MNKTLVLTSIALSFILAASLASITSKQMALAIDLSSIKQKATDLLTGNKNNNNITNNNSTSLSSSSLKQQATNAVGNLVKQ